MIDTYSDMWNCFAWVIRALLIVALGIGIIVGIVLTFNCNNRIQRSNEIVGHLADGSPTHSIPTGTQIVAAGSDDCRVFAYIVRDAKGNHYYVGLLDREVRRIDEVDVVKSQEILCEPNRQEFKNKVEAPIWDSSQDTSR